jgi:DNA polymerase-1
MAINMPIQGTEADIMKLAMIEVGAYLETYAPEIRMILQVHDELLFEGKPDVLREHTQKILHIMESVAEIGVPIVVEAKMGVSWGKLTPATF